MSAPHSRQHATSMCVADDRTSTGAVKPHSVATGTAKSTSMGASAGAGKLSKKERVANSKRRRKQPSVLKKATTKMSSGKPTPSRESRGLPPAQETECVVCNQRFGGKNQTKLAAKCRKQCMVKQLCRLSLSQIKSNPQSQE
eukprot:m.881 g.881  ORF g.881 m.881 type:complete len:142 (+) comp501_c0_seq1:211-636(+)